MITSFRHDNKRKEKRRRILIGFILLLVLIFFVRGPLSASLGGVLAAIGRPFWLVKVELQNDLSDFASVFTSKDALAKENAQLHEELDRIAAEAYSREKLADENEELKARLGRNPEISFILGRVIASPAESPYDTLVIDAGEDVGIREGMDAYADGDFVIGKVTRTWKRSALITLLSAPENELSVTVGSSSIPAMARGVGGGNMRIVLPKGSDVSVGDLVDIPALGPSYAGVVSAIDQPQGTSLEALFLRLPFNMNQIKWVYIAQPIDTKVSPSHT